MKYDYDLFVIGAGSGGVRAARLAALQGAKVGVAEEDRVGGTCVIRGCIPKKFMVYASELSETFKMARGYGWSVEAPSFDWPTFLEAKDREIARLSGIYVANLNNAGAELIHSRAEFTDAHTIRLTQDGRSVTAETILIATGGWPSLPEGLEGIGHAMSSNEAFHLESLPKRILVVGGGYIAVEFAGIFNGLGVETSLLYRGANILRGFDDGVRAHLAEEMERRGIKILLGAHHERLEKADRGIVSHLTSGHQVESDVVLFATGRRPKTDGLGLEAAGVVVDSAGAVTVDAYSRTSAPHIWAVGDVTNRVNLTPVAIREAAAFVETAFKGNPTAFDHATVASAVFSQPPVGVVGLTEAEARQGGRPVDIYRSAFRPMKGTFYGGGERAFMKLVVDQVSGQVLGCHVVGPDAAEIIQMAAIPIKIGVTKAQWDSACAVHPTAAEELVTMHAPVVGL